MFYRVAMQAKQSTKWQWKSTVLSSLDTLFHFLRIYQVLPQDSLRVFSSYVREELNELLAQENRGLASCSVTSEQFLQARGICSLRTSQPEASLKEYEVHDEPVVGTASASAALPVGEGRIPIPALLGSSSLSVMDRRRLELELGAGGDHDVPYTFSVSISTPQTLAWMRLLAKVQRGELEP